MPTAAPAESTATRKAILTLLRDKFAGMAPRSVSDTTWLKRKLAIQGLPEMTPWDVLSHPATTEAVYGLLNDRVMMFVGRGPSAWERMAIQFQRAQQDPTLNAVVSAGVLIELLTDKKNRASRSMERAGWDELIQGVTDEAAAFSLFSRTRARHPDTTDPLTGEVLPPDAEARFRNAGTGSKPSTSPTLDHDPYALDPEPLALTSGRWSDEPEPPEGYVPGSLHVIA